MIKINVLIAPGFIVENNSFTKKRPTANSRTEQEGFYVVSLDKVKDYWDMFDPKVHFEVNEGNGCTMEESIECTRGLVLGFTTASSGSDYRELWYDYESEDGGNELAIRTGQLDSWFSRPDEIVHVSERYRWDKTPYAERYQRHNKQIVRELEYLHVPNAKYIEHLQDYLQTFVLDRDDVSLNMSVDLRTRVNRNHSSTIKFELTIELSNNWEDLVIWLRMPHKNDEGTTEWEISTNSRKEGHKSFYGNYTELNRQIKMFIHQIPRIGRFLNLRVPTSASPVTWHIREKEYKDLIAPERLFFDEDAKTAEGLEMTETGIKIVGVKQ